MANPVTKNMRHGRIFIQSGDATPLVTALDFTDGNLTWSESFPTNVVKSRGRNREVTRGDEQTVKWSFSATFRDKTTMRTLRDKVHAAQTATKGSLTPAAVNTVTVPYGYEQGSIEITTTGTWVKDVTGTTPTVVNHYAEVAGSEDVEGVIRATQFKVKLASGVTSVSYTFDAVGAGTLGSDQCQGGVKAFDLLFKVYDPCDPPIGPDDASYPNEGTVVETYTLADAYLLGDDFAEGDERDTFTFNGEALIDRVAVTTAA